IIPTPKACIMKRGDPHIPGDEVHPGFLTALGFTAETPPEKVPEGLKSTGRRLALAKWIVSPDNPLTARVIANRLWHYYFGRGIVATPNDFGKNGQRPTNPELLDWLASELVNPGVGSQGSGVGAGSSPAPDSRLPTPWSLTHLHYLIVTSASYRQSSAFDSAK